MSDFVFGKKVTMQDGATSTGNGTVIDVKGFSACTMQVEGISGDTITFECTLDDTTWYAIQVASLTDGTVSTTATADGIYSTVFSGISQIRARVSTYSAGTIVVTGKAVTTASGMSFADIDVAGTETVTLAANDGVDIGDVDVASIAAGETHLGQVGGEGGTVAQTPTITAGAYSVNDNVGGLLTFADAARVSGGGGYFNKLVIIDDAQQDAELELWLFDQTFTQGADNAAWSPSEADLENAIDVISTTDGTWYDSATQGVCMIELARRYDLDGTSLFGRLVTRGAPTYAATDDLTVKLGVIKD